MIFILTHTYWYLLDTMLKIWEASKSIYQGRTDEKGEASEIRIFLYLFCLLMLQRLD